VMDDRYYQWSHHYHCLCTVHQCYNQSDLYHCLHTVHWHCNRYIHPDYVFGFSEEDKHRFLNTSRCCQHSQCQWLVTIHVFFHMILNCSVIMITVSKKLITYLALEQTKIRAIHAYEWQIPFNIICHWVIPKLGKYFAFITILMLIHHKMCCLIMKKVYYHINMLSHMHDETWC